MADLIVRDQKDYPNAVEARASLPEMYAEFPYVGVWLNPGDGPGLEMYVFTTRTQQELLDGQWTLVVEP